MKRLPYKSLRRIGLAVLAVGTLILLIADRTAVGERLIYWHTVAAGLSPTTPQWGYSLENQRFSRALRFSLTGFQEAPWAHKQYGVKVKKIYTIRWLSHGRVAYFDLLIEHEDSGIIDDYRSRVICDYEKHKLIVTSKLTLWRPYDWHKGDPSKNWTTEKEFDVILAAYGD